MSKIVFDEHGLKRLEMLKRDFNYPDCNTTPLTEEEIKNLKPGTSCYIISNAGIRLGMASGSYKHKDEYEVTFFTHVGINTYKAKNAGKTYNVFKVYVN